IGRTKQIKQRSDQNGNAKESPKGFIRPHKTRLEIKKDRQSSDHAHKNLIRPPPPVLSDTRYQQETKGPVHHAKRYFKCEMKKKPVLYRQRQIPCFKTIAGKM